MKVLNVIESAYRATLEEQDDTIVWITHAMKGAGANVDVLLRGNAVNYAARNQDASGLAFGSKVQAHAPTIGHDVAGLIAKGVTVHVVEEDVAERGLERSDLIADVTPVSRSGVPTVYDRYDQVWTW